MHRRVDVAVTVPTGHRVAVEVQDSAISVTEMKRRNSADQRSGFFGTVWVFTSRRAARLLAARADHEIRVPDEIRWVQNRYAKGVFVIDERAERIWRCHFGRIVRPGEYYDWYDPDGELQSVDRPERTLKSTKTVSRVKTGFTLRATPSRYHRPESPDWAIVFAAASQSAGRVPQHRQPMAA